MHDDYDTPWKEVLVRYLPDFMAFYFPHVYAAIDWSRPVSFLDQELAALTDGWRWRPARFGYQVLDCRLQLDFPVVKLRDFEAQMAQLHSDPNPFALVTLAHLQARRTRRNVFQRRHAKWYLTKLLLRREWDRQRVIDLYRTIDWLLRLPPSLESRVRRGIHLIREGADMTYLSSLERYGMEQGLQQGQAAQLLDMLELRFGTSPDAVRKRVSTAEVPQLRRWARNFVYAERLEQVFAAE